MTSPQYQIPPEECFSEQFGREATWLVSAPGRINLIGEHIDYLGGFVMPAAIDRSVNMAVGANGEEIIRIWTTALRNPTPVSFSLSDLTRQSGDRSWLNYVIGVVEMLRRAGITPVGFDAAITSDLPVGAGLSSSAALETATALAVEATTASPLDPVERARLCQKAEHEFAGVPCGLMDQLAVGLGQENHALFVDCRDTSVSPVPIPEGVALVVSDTGVNHALGDGEYKARRDSCETALKNLERPSWRDVAIEDIERNRKALGEVLYRRSRHVVTEMARVHALRDALEMGHFPSVATIMKAGHYSLRDDFEVSCPELDCLVDAAYEFGTGNGLIGSRMTGGGFGGSTVSLITEDAAGAFKSHLADTFRAQFSRGANIFVTKASAGARVDPA